MEVMRGCRPTLDIIPLSKESTCITNLLMSKSNFKAESKMEEPKLEAAFSRNNLAASKESPLTKDQDNCQR
jgi:hypothetical protein